MSRYKVSYGRCARDVFLEKKSFSNLEPGRLYFIKDTGEIFRASSENTYESYQNRIHLVDSWPNTWQSGNIYVQRNGRAKIVVEDDNGSQTIVELVGDGSGSGDDSPDLSTLIADVEILKEQLRWTFYN